MSFGLSFSNTPDNTDLKMSLIGQALLGGEACYDYASEEYLDSRILSVIFVFRR